MIIYALALPTTGMGCVECFGSPVHGMNAV